MVVPRSILIDFRPVLGPPSGPRMLKIIHWSNRWKRFFQPCVSLAKMRSARPPGDAKKQQKPLKVVQKQCVSQIGLCDNLGGLWLSF